MSSPPAEAEKPEVVKPEVVVAEKPRPPSPAPIAVVESLPPWAREAGSSYEDPIELFDGDLGDLDGDLGDLDACDVDGRAADCLLTVGVDIPSAGAHTVSFLRVGGDLAGSPLGRAMGASFNMVAIAVFLLSTLRAVVKGALSQPEPTD